MMYRLFICLSIFFFKFLREHSRYIHRFRLSFASADDLPAEIFYCIIIETTSNERNKIMGRYAKYNIVYMYYCNDETKHVCMSFYLARVKDPLYINYVCMCVCACACNIIMNRM